MKTNANHPISPLKYGDKSFYEADDPIFENKLTGLTKREYFAACALQGFSVGGIIPGFENTIAEKAVSVADALIQALNKDNEPTV